MSVSMSSELQAPAATPPRLAVRRPVATFLVIAFAITWPALAVPDLFPVPDAPFLLVSCYLGLAGTALLLTRRIGGRPAVRELLAHVVRWRFGLVRWVWVLTAMPLLTVAVAAATGTLRAPSAGWPAVGVAYLAQVVLLGALLFNVWEELGWTGFVQSRLMARRGLLVGSLLTAPGFVAIHLPLLFAPGWTWSAVGISFVALLVGAPFFRYLLGTQWIDTGSLLAVGLLHASFNASGALGVTVGGWQQIPAMIVLTVVVAAARRRTRR